jgi:hypothetical protein
MLKRRIYAQILLISIFLFCWTAKLFSQEGEFYPH